MTEKSKKVLAAAGGLLLCAALIWAISAQFERSGRGDAQALEKPDKTAVSVQPVHAPGTVTETQAVTAAPIPDQTDQAEQIIQADPAKPTATPDFTPTQAQLDSGEVPTGGDTPPHPIPAATPAVPVAGGGAGQVYVPGFGWVDNGGENHGGVAKDMYENGNKVGTMD